MKGEEASSPQEWNEQFHKGGLYQNILRLKSLIRQVFSNGVYFFS